jgi:hypothetical protein
VRSRSKVPESAREDRPWRTSQWSDDTEGDMFSMGARSSTQYARVYDRRGFTRFELKLKQNTAQLAATELLSVVLNAPDAFTRRALAWVRRFVDFVDAASNVNVSRRALLPWWATFLTGAEVAYVTLDSALPRSLADVRVWVERQCAPSLALLVEAFKVNKMLHMTHINRNK